MKTKTLNIGLVFITLALLTSAGAHSAFAQSTAFTYQGRLQVGAIPANGSYDLRFALYDALAGGNAVGGALTNTATGVSNGLFIATLEFGGVFNGANYWLEIAARTNGNDAFSTLSPRQPITPVPQALYAASAGSAATAGIAGSANSVSAANLTGTLADSQLSTNIVRLTIPNTTTQATGGAVVTSGFITSANVTNGGSGYTVAPTVTVADVSGSNVLITATVSGGSVVSLTVQNAGSQYSTGATLTIAPPPSNAYQTFKSGNIFNGVNTFTNTGNNFVGAFSGTFGNLSGGTMTISNNLNLPATTTTAGILYSGGNTLMHAFGNNNFFAGAGAGNLTMTGLGQNMGVGVNALHADTSGYGNTANGFWALINNTSGIYNTANGNQALSRNTTGNNNTGTGTGSLLGNTTGNNNTATGEQALGLNTTGSQNTANGMQTLQNNTSGGNNTANGYNALFANTTGIQNTANGAGALQNNTIGAKNTANGFQALFSNTNGVSNVANGYQALFANTSGNNNTANGDWALNLNTTGSNNTANGHQALNFNTTGSYNTADGDSALHNNTSGSYNTASGDQALFSNTNGSYNTANGDSALHNNTSGGANTASGFWALLNNTSGNYDTASGMYALWANTTGGNNTANGYAALYSNTTGTNNIALGYQAGVNLTTGNNNIDIGNLGVSGESSTIRIGMPGIHTNTFIAGLINGNGGGLTNVSAAMLSGLAPTNFWQTGGNTGTSPLNGNFLGTTDNQPLEFKANNTTALRLESYSGTINVIAGFVAANAALPGAFGATISGGGYSGSGNRAGSFATVGGGYRNDALGSLSSIGGGNYNTADGVNTTVGGGYTNRAGGQYAAVLGGSQNSASGDYSAVGGGTNNVASGYGATVPGGFGNTAAGNYSFAAGSQALATNQGAFVWSDGSANTSSTVSNQFLARASGGVTFFTSTNTTTGASLAPGSGAWSALSDRNSKDNFHAVNSVDILNKVAALPLRTWNYKTQDKNIRHLGPVAQDFFAAFQVGEDEKHITTIDADGVALAAIQGLNQKVEEQRAENAELKQRLEKLERLINQRTGGMK